MTIDGTWDQIQEEKKNPGLREARLRKEQKEFQSGLEWEFRKFKELYLQTFWHGTPQKEG